MVLLGYTFKDPIIKAAKTIKRHWDGIVRHESKINNGILEGSVSKQQSKARLLRHLRITK